MVRKWNVGSEAARDTIGATNQRGVKSSMETFPRRGNFIKVYPITAWREAGQSLIDFTDDVGVAGTLLTDGAGEFTGRNTELVKHDRRMRMQLHNTEQGRHNQNHAVEHTIWFSSKCCMMRTAKKVTTKQ